MCATDHSCYWWPHHRLRARVPYACGRDTSRRSHCNTRLGGGLERNLQTVQPIVIRTTATSTTGRPAPPGRSLLRPSLLAAAATPVRSHFNIHPSRRVLEKSQTVQYLSFVQLTNTWYYWSGPNHLDTRIPAPLLAAAATRRRHPATFNRTFDPVGGSGGPRLYNPIAIRTAASFSVLQVRTGGPWTWVQA
jgi:hypothetical protein